MVVQKRFSLFVTNKLKHIPQRAPLERPMSFSFLACSQALESIVAKAGSQLET
jgi:hypothetical protein